MSAVIGLLELRNQSHLAFFLGTDQYTTQFSVTYLKMDVRVNIKRKLKRFLHTLTIFLTKTYEFQICTIIQGGTA